MNEVDQLARELLEHVNVRQVDEPTAVRAYNMMQALLDSKDPKARHHKERITALKLSEEKGDLCCMEYNSWILPGNLFQKSLREIVNPVFWGSAYFETFNFVKNLPDLCLKMPNEVSGVLLKVKTGYKVVLSSSKSPKWETYALSKAEYDPTCKQLILFSNKGLTNVQEGYATTS